MIIAMIITAQRTQGIEYFDSTLTNRCNNFTNPCNNLEKSMNQF